MRWLVVLPLVVGCRGSAPAAPSCAVAGGRLLAVAAQELAAARVDEPTRAAAAAQLPSLRDALVTACEDGAWSPEVRACLAGAADHAALQACQARLTEAQRRALEAAAAP